LRAYEGQVSELKRRGGYVTADVIDVKPDTPGLDTMLAKFNIEHRHDEDEVRYIIAGRGLFHIHPASGPVIAIEVEAGDLIRVPRGTLHWFDLCGDRRIRAIRLFQDATGWTPHTPIAAWIEATNRFVWVRDTFASASGKVSRAEPHRRCADQSPSAGH